MLVYDGEQAHGRLLRFANALLPTANSPHTRADISRKFRLARAQTQTILLISAGFRFGGGGTWLIRRVVGSPDR